MSSQENQKLFNPKMLTLARDARGLTQQQLADLMNVHQGKISRLEDGILPITEDDLIKLEKALGYLKDYYYIHKKSPALPLYRKRVDFPVKVLNKIRAKICIFESQAAVLLKGADISLKVPSLDPDNTGKSPLEIAKIVRTYLGVPNGPIMNLSFYIEEAGCIIKYFNFESQKMDGLSIWIDEKIPLILLNPTCPPDRIRWTLAHELGHIVMHKLPNDAKTEEDQANNFASEFLMPENEIKTEFYPVTIDRLCRLKLKWKVSIQALLMRAADLQVINDRQKQNLFIQLSRYGYRKQEPHSEMIPKEEPTLLRELINFYRKDLSYSNDEFCKALWYTGEDDFSADFDESIPVLRLIK